MDFLFALVVIGVIGFLAYKKVPAVKAKIDGLFSKSE